MRILSVFLGGSGLFTFFVPQLRGFLPLAQFNTATWQWISVGAVGMAALVYFLAPKD